MRKDIQPSSDLKNKKIAIYQTDKFDSGVIKDMPASELPNNSLADGKNVNVYPTEIQGRLGTRLYSDLSIPAITGKTGYLASKTDYRITINQNAFTSSDISNYFVFPGATQQHYEIIKIINGYTCETSIIGNMAPTPGCYMRGRLNLWGFHTVQKKWIFLFKNDVYIGDTALTTLTKAVIVSRESPSNSYSTYCDFDNNYGVLFNSNGIFKINLSVSPAIAFKINTPIPDIAIAQQPYNANMNYQYGYIYSVSRIDGNSYFRNRLDQVTIETESGINNWDSEKGDYRDVWTRYPIGNGYNNLSLQADSSNPKVVGPLYVPKLPNTSPQKYQRHLTHFTIFRTLDKYGKYKQGTSELSLNNPERFVWVKDLRICAAFYCRKYNGKIESKMGKFELADVGSTIEFDDGSKETIMEYIDAYTVRYTIYHYYAEETGYMAAAIGNGSVVRATQSGTTVTRLAGDSFSSSDVGATLTWAPEYRSYITAYIDSNTVTVSDSDTKTITGCTLNPEYRYYNDSISDGVLRTRESSLLCSTRTFETMENANVGTIAPGFMVSTRKGEGLINYCQLETGKEYIAGYHNKGYQFSTTVTDDIQSFIVVTNRLIVLASNRTWFTSTNMANIISDPLIAIAISVLPGFDILDGNIGCFDVGSIQEIDDGMFQFLTSEIGGIGWRKFDGFKYGQDELEITSIGQSNYGKDISSIKKNTASSYDGTAGLIIWGRV